MTKYCITFVHTFFFCIDVFSFPNVSFDTAGVCFMRLCSYCVNGMHISPLFTENSYSSFCCGPITFAAFSSLIKSASPQLLNPYLYGNSYEKRRKHCSLFLLKISTHTNTLFLNIYSCYLQIHLSRSFVSSISSNWWFCLCVYEFYSKGSCWINKNNQHLD